MVDYFGHFYEFVATTATTRSTRSTPRRRCAASSTRGPLRRDHEGGQRAAELRHHPAHQPGPLRPVRRAAGHGQLAAPGRGDLALRVRRHPGPVPGPAGALRGGVPRAARRPPAGGGAPQPAHLRLRGEGVPALAGGDGHPGHRRHHPGERHPGRARPGQGDDGPPRGAARRGRGGRRRAGGPLPAHGHHQGRPPPPGDEGGPVRPGGAVLGRGDRGREGRGDLPADPRPPRHRPRGVPHGRQLGAQRHPAGARAGRPGGARAVPHHLEHEVVEDDLDALGVPVLTSLRDLPPLLDRLTG
jgi:hypothetical protein